MRVHWRVVVVACIAPAGQGSCLRKTRTTITDGELVAKNLSGYVDTKSGRKLAFALFENDYGPIKSIQDVAKVFADQGAITNVLYETT